MINKQKNLLVICYTKTIANNFLLNKYLKTFNLKKVYNIVYVKKVDDIRGYKSEDCRVLFTPMFYKLRDIDKIRDIIRVYKFTILESL